MSHSVGLARRPRLLYLDNLRTALTCLVVIHHAAIAYSDIPLWYYAEPVHDRSAAALDILLLLDQTFFMGCFFAIAGYFVPSSYDRKGGGRFLRDRLVRLGIPLVIFALFLRPILTFGIFVRLKAAAGGFHPSYWHFYLRSWDPGPMWFVEVLLVFSALYVLARRIGVMDRPANASPIGRRLAVLSILGYALLLGVLTYFWRIVVPIGQYWPIIGLPTPAFLPQYSTLVIVGVIAYRRGWAQRFPVSAGWFGLALFLSMVMSAMILTGIEGPKMKLAIGGGTMLSMEWAILESLLAVGIIVALFVLFRERFNRQGPLARFMSDNAYTVYIIHPLVLVALNYAFSWLHAIDLVKFTVVAALAIPLCWISARVVRSLPYAKRVV